MYRNILQLSLRKKELSIDNLVSKEKVKLESRKVKLKKTTTKWNLKDFKSIKSFERTRSCALPESVALLLYLA